MFFPGMKLGSKIFSFIDIFMATYQRSPKTEIAGPPGERVQPFAIPAHPWMYQIFMNDLLTEQGQQRSRVIR